MIKFNKKNLITAVFSFLILVCLVLIITTAATSHKSALHLVSTGNSDFGWLYAVNETAKKNQIKNDKTAYFSFSEKQRAQIKNIYSQGGNASITVRVTFSFPSENQLKKLEKYSDFPFAFGFLEEKDFLSRNNVSLDLRNKVSVQSDIKKFYNPSYPKFSLDISFAIPKKQKSSEDNIPYGFFVSSLVNCSLNQVAVTPSQIGFDKSAPIHFYGFASNGGTLNPNAASFDFTGALLVFPLQYSENFPMPDFSMKFYNPGEKLENGELRKIRFNLGGEQISVVNKIEKISLPSAGFNNPFSKLELQQNAEFVSSVILQNGNPETCIIPSSKVLKPIKTDPGLILSWKTKNWRNADYEVFEWDRFPGIIFFDIRNYAIQDRFFTRLAFFVEKEGFKGRLLTNEELEGKHGYNAHDYNAQSLAKFFNKAKETGFRLNEEEEILKSILLSAGLLIKNDGEGEYYLPGNGAVLSISRESELWRRTMLFAHEGWHTIYFTDEEFRNFVSAAYYTMDSNSLEFLLDFFRSQPNLAYDTNDEFLMQNEFMAYIMQNTVSGVAPYFVHCAERGSVMKYTPELSRYIRETKGIAFEDAALMLNDYVRDRWGIVCGNIALVTR